MSGTHAQPEGITDPPIDSLLQRVPSKYALVIYAAKRARQINTYYQQVADGMYSTPGPLLESEVDEKPLSIALREINEGLLEFREADEEDKNEDALADNAMDLLLDEHHEPDNNDLADIEAAIYDE